MGRGSSDEQTSPLESLFGDGEQFEYGVRHLDSGRVHRSGMSEDEAREWVAEWIEMDGKPDAFAVIRRPIGEWQAAPSPDGSVAVDSSSEKDPWQRWQQIYERLNGIVERAAALRDWAEAERIAEAERQAEPEID